MTTKLTVLVAGSTGIFSSKTVPVLNLMKKCLITLLGILIAIVFVTSPAIAVFHADQSKTFAVVKYQFSFKNFVSNTKTPSTQNSSVVGITSAPKYAEFLPERHAIEVPENYYVLAGNFEFFGDRADQTVQAQAEDVVQISAGLPYGYKNTSSQPGKLLLAATSKGFKNFIFSGVASDVIAKLNQFVFQLGLVVVCK